MTASAPAPATSTPGDPTRLSNAAQLVNGANTIDSVAGFTGFDDANSDGEVQQAEISAVPGSLLDKAKVAQLVFDNRFLTPGAPEVPSFFLIPGNNQVTVLWTPSVTETAGDPYFQVASTPTIVPEGGGDPVENPLFDPNYRQFDVEGYRVYRGRVDSPNSLSLLASFDYTGTVISDFTSQINSGPGCAPELGISTITVDPVTGDTTFGCPVDFDSLVPGVAPTVSVDVPLVGQITQVKRGARLALATGFVINTTADTAISGAESNCLAAGSTAECSLRDNGVPFIYVDQTARNNLRYFYSVVSFDINSFQSGPSSIESPRTTKPIIPVAGASNVTSEATFTQAIVGRGVTVSENTTVPTIDGTTGIFSGKFPPSNAGSLSFVGDFARAIFQGEGSFAATLIGLGMGDARNGIPTNYTFETSGGGALDTVNLQLTQTLDLTEPTAQSGPFPAATADPTLSARYGIPPGYVQSGIANLTIPSYQPASGWGRGCQVDGLFGDNCTYNGPRWFSGANETKADPNAGNVAGTSDATDNNNAGELPGVLTIQNPQSYHQTGAGMRAVEAILGSGTRAADINLYWGEGGVVDSVIDITNNVEVPRLDSLGAGWGFLTTANTSGAGSGDARPGDVSLLDFGCVHPLFDPSRHPDQTLGCTAAAPYVLSNTAVAGPVVISGGDPATVVAVAPVRANPGFGLFVAGHIFMIELAPGAGLPADGTVWTLRSYHGYVNGGNGAAGATGPYTFTSVTRAFSALGASLALNYTSTNAVNATTATDLRRVHTVPDPYYVTSAFEQTTDTKVIKFVNLPAKAIVRIYSSSGVLVSLLEHNSASFGGSADWNVRNRNNQVVASGVYFYHIEAGDARRVGRFTVVNFAQ